MISDGIQKSYVAWNSPLELFNGMQETKHHITPYIKPTPGSQQIMFSTQQPTRRHPIEKAQLTNKTFPSQQPPLLHQTKFLDLFKPNLKISEELTWPEQTRLPQNKRGNGITINRNFSHDKLYYQNLGYLVMQNVPFKPSLPANQGMMSVIKPPQLEPPPSLTITKGIMSVIEPPKIISRTSNHWMPLLHQ